MSLICLFLELYFLVILGSIVMSWVPTTEGTVADQIKRVLRSLTDPLFRPFRSLLPPVRMGGMALDLSPIIVIVLLQIVTAYICT